jgi:hypothetical protein
MRSQSFIHRSVIRLRFLLAVCSVAVGCAPAPAAAAIPRPRSCSTGPIPRFSPSASATAPTRWKSCSTTCRWAGGAPVAEHARGWRWMPSVIAHHHRGRIDAGRMVELRSGRRGASRAVLLRAGGAGAGIALPSEVATESPDRRQAVIRLPVFCHPPSDWRKRHAVCWDPVPRGPRHMADTSLAAPIPCSARRPGLAKLEPEPARSGGDLVLLAITTSRAVLVWTYRAGSFLS